MQWNEKTFIYSTVAQIIRRIEILWTHKHKQPLKFMWPISIYDFISDLLRD